MREGGEGQNFSFSVHGVVGGHGLEFPFFGVLFIVFGVFAGRSGGSGTWIFSFQCIWRGKQGRGGRDGGFSVFWRCKGGMGEGGRGVEQQHARDNKSGVFFQGLVLGLLLPCSCAEDGQIIIIVTDYGRYVIIPKTQTFNSSDTAQQSGTQQENQMSTTILHIISQSSIQHTVCYVQQQERGTAVAKAKVFLRARGVEDTTIAWY